MSTQPSASPSVESGFARDVREGLLKPERKELPCRYFYDDVGSALFDAITLLPEYGLTRADARLIRAHAPEVAARLRPPLAVAELGSGSGAKTRLLLEALGGRPVYTPIDVSESALEKCAREVGHAARVEPFTGSYLDGMEEASARRSRRTRLLVLFLGSTIGNFGRREAEAFLGEVRARLRPGDALLLGVDLVKPAAQLLAAYDDPAGVTAAFNLNLLARINRELGASIDLRAFAHQARYNLAARCIEMHLVSRARQQVAVPAAGIAVELAAGETILTESSHKFGAAEIAAMARRAGFLPEVQWLDDEWPFAETLLVAGR